LRKGGSLIAKIHQIAGRILTRKFKEHNINEISHSQGRILFALWQREGSSVQELADMTALNVSTLSLMLDRLEAGGHLRRVTCATDKRRILIYATGQHTALQNSYEQILGNLQGAFYAGFSDEEIVLAETLLERIYENLSNYADRKD